MRSSSITTRPGAGFQRRNFPDEPPDLAMEAMSVTFEALTEECELFSIVDEPELVAAIAG